MRKTLEMINSLKDTNSNDKENRRIEIDRRQFSYTHHLPERRDGQDRRRDDDRNHASEDK